MEEAVAPPLFIPLPLSLSLSLSLFFHPKTLLYIAYHSWFPVGMPSLRGVKQFG